MKRLINKLLYFFTKHLLDEMVPFINNSQVVQRQLYYSYGARYGKSCKELQFSDAGFRVYSQADEDGLLLYIFSKIGFSNKLCVDIGSNSPYDSNVTNLICNWGFHGLLIDGGDVSVSKSFYKLHPDTRYSMPTIVQKWITVQNINSILTANNFVGEIDLLSIDIDGVDYWIWESINVINPRVVVLEYMNIFSLSTSVSVPYDPNFIKNPHTPDFFGASLQAFIKLGMKKGYRFIGCNKYNYNAFFLRNDVRDICLPTVKSKIFQPFLHQNNRIYDIAYAKKNGWIEV